MPAAVLDASAVLALVLQEPGGDAVIPYVGAGVLSVVNYSEVVARLCDRGGSAELIRTQIEGLLLRLVAFDEETALAAGLLRQSTRELGLSFADRACLATASRLGMAAVTADKEWAELNLGIEIELIR